MADLAIFASGNGSNFQAIAERVLGGPHRVVCLVCDVPGAAVLSRASALGIPGFCVPYEKGRRMEAERTILDIVERANTNAIALAGFMRLLSPWFIDHFQGPIVNLHPSLLPRHPGTHAIEKSFHSGDTEFGITVHEVDYGLDTGPIIFQTRLTRNAGDTLESVTERIHAFEHEYYPQTIIGVLDDLHMRSNGGLD